MKKRLIGILDYIDIYVFFVIMFTLDYLMRLTYLKTAITEMNNLVSFLLTFAWVITFTGIVTLFSGKVRKGVATALMSFFWLLSFVQYSYYLEFNKIPSVMDLTLAKEAGEFQFTKYAHWNHFLTISTLLVVVGLVVIWKFKSKKIKHKIFPIVFTTIGILVNIGSRTLMPELFHSADWLAYTNPSNVYYELSDTLKAQSYAGMYEYTARDIWLNLMSPSKVDVSEDIRVLDDYYAGIEDFTPHNEMTGSLEGKDIYLIQLESVDNYMLNENSMPFTYSLQQQGINFVNHYSTTYAVGRTFNTEFMVNTSFVPPYVGEAPAYSFSKNTFPYSLPNILNDLGYTSNSFHGNKGEIYNRSVIHQKLGYNRYYSGEDMNSEVWKDSTLIEGYDLFHQGDKNFNFIITISGHSPYTYDDEYCPLYIDEVKSYAALDDESYQCSLTHIKETDIFIEELYNKLESDGKLENSAFIIYSDHYAYSGLSAEAEEFVFGEKDKNLRQNTPFFIWYPGVESNTVETINHSLDMLPTIANMVGADVNHKYWIGDDIFSKTEDGYTYFYDGSWLDDEVYYNPGTTDPSTLSEKSIRNYEKAKLAHEMSWKVLTSDYFKERNEK